MQKSGLLLSGLFLSFCASTAASALDAYPDYLSTSVGKAGRVDVLRNDRGGHFWVSGVNHYSVNGGRAYVVGGRQINYTPKPGFTGNDEFWYEITDSHGRKNSARVKVQVFGGGHRNPVQYKPRRHHKPKPSFNISYSNHGGWNAHISAPSKRSHWKRHRGHHRGGSAPIAHQDAFVTYSGSGQVPLHVMSNDRGQGIYVANTNQYTHQGGRAWVANDHTGHFIMYTPKPGFRGVDELWYVLRDRNGRTSSTKALITVH